MRKVSILIFVILLLASSSFASWKRAALYGADVRALVIDPKKPDLVYLGTSEGEVYVSKDGASTWLNPRGGIPFPGYVVDNLLIDRKERLWAACWGLWDGGVIAFSTDGGVTWTRRDKGLEDFSVRSIAIGPKNPDLVVVGGLTGVWKSEDSGRNWTKISDQENVESLAIDPRDENRIYVGTWRQAWRTDDGGATWKHIANGMVLDTDVFAIHIDDKNPENVWLSTCGWVYNSVDHGENWTRYRDGFNNRRIQDVDLDPADSNHVYAGSVAGLYVTADNGTTWTLSSDENLVINAIGLHPKRPDRIILGVEGDGVYVSCDGGKSFARSNTGLYNVKVASVVADPAQRGTLYAVVLFGGAASGVYVSTDDGSSWSRLNETRLPEILSLNIRNAPGSPHFIAGTEKGFYFSDDGRSWTQAEPVATPMRVEKILTYNDRRLFAATSDGVYTTKDGGKIWYRLSSLTDRTLDIALGSFNSNRALFALSSGGLFVFDGTQWLPIDHAPARGRQLAIRRDGDNDLVVIAGFQGVTAGHVDFKRKWHDVDLGDRSFATVFQTNASSTLFLGSRNDRELFIGGERKAEWRTLGLPLEPREIAAIAPDPFDASRYYFATNGQGLYIFDGGSKQPSLGGDAHFAAGTK